jgi:hypothetical protein
MLSAYSSTKITASDKKSISNVLCAKRSIEALHGPRGLAVFVGFIAEQKTLMLGDRVQQRSTMDCLEQVALGDEIQNRNLME